MEKQTTLLSACCEAQLSVAEDAIGNEVYVCSECEEPLVLEVEDTYFLDRFEDHEYSE
jgi:hypothetical protein